MGLGLGLGLELGFGFGFGLALAAEYLDEALFLSLGDGPVDRGELAHHHAHLGLA